MGSETKHFDLNVVHHWALSNISDVFLFFYSNFDAAQLITINHYRSMVGFLTYFQWIASWW